MMCKLLSVPLDECTTETHCFAINIKVIPRCHYDIEENPSYCDLQNYDESMSVIVKGTILFDAVLPSPARNEYIAAMRVELD